MKRKVLSVEIPEELNDNFIRTVTEIGGRWRSRRTEENFTDVIASAVRR